MSVKHDWSSRTCHRGRPCEALLDDPSIASLDACGKSVFDGAHGGRVPNIQLRVVHGVIVASPAWDRALRWEGRAVAEQVLEKESGSLPNSSKSLKYKRSEGGPILPSCILVLRAFLVLPDAGSP